MAPKWIIDNFMGPPLPVLLVRGWCTDPCDVNIALECADGTLQGPALLCRELRPDVVAVEKLTFAWPGFVAEFHLKSQPRSVRIYGRRVEVPQPERFCTAEPHYGQLYQTDRVLHRDDIYCVGPPVAANPAIVDLASALLGSRVLDFGCGSGDLVAKLRALGRDAIGIEIDRPAIREHLVADATPFVKLYNGGLPLPYADQAFDSAIATEVIEHVEDPHAVAKELMRVSRTSVFVTVPDIASIPFSWPTGTVPWHLLEASHVNFFNAKSLGTLFRPQFTPTKQFRIFNLMIGEHFVPGSIGVLFTRAQ
jgi:2-polyprenyl-3-methyl-5-hydroxy-6-metoxy-1,4-benzoquinol methylase